LTDITTQYGSRQQYITTLTSELLNAKDTRWAQEVLGTLLYYAHLIECNLEPSIGTIATEQSCATMLTMVAITKLLNRVATYPDTSVTYHASGMQLYVLTDITTQPSSPHPASYKVDVFFFLHTSIKGW
jgi:hypothetical protein